MTTSGIKYHSGPVRIIEALEASSQTFAAGDLVYLNAGVVTLCTDDQNIMGIALKPSTTVTSAWTTIPVQVITPEALFVAQVDTTSALTQVGEDYGLNTATTQCHAVDIGDTTTTCVRVERLDPRDGASATGRVIIRFNTVSLQSYKTA